MSVQYATSAFKIRGERDLTAVYSWDIRILKQGGQLNINVHGIQMVPIRL